MHAASAREARRSPPAISPSEAPTSSEIAEVTVIAVWRELQNSQKTRPENRHAYRPASGGRFASDASPMPGRQQVGRERDAGDEVGAQPARARSRAASRERGQEAREAAGRHRLHQIGTKYSSSAIIMYTAMSWTPLYQSAAPAAKTSAPISTVRNSKPTPPVLNDNWNGSGPTK